jgi:hypothetical protein
MSKGDDAELPNFQAEDIWKEDLLLCWSKKVKKQFHVATTSSSSAESCTLNNKLNCIDSERSLYSGASLQSLLPGQLPCEQFQMNTKQLKH